MFGKVFNFMKDKQILHKKKQAILDMTNFLSNYGFSPEEAMNIAKTFWLKHEKKLKELI